MNMEWPQLHTDDLCSIKVTQPSTQISTSTPFSQYPQHTLPIAMPIIKPCLNTVSPPLPPTKLQEPWMQVQSTMKSMDRMFNTDFSGWITGTANTVLVAQWLGSAIKQVYPSNDPLPIEPLLNILKFIARPSMSETYFKRIALLLAAIVNTRDSESLRLVNLLTKPMMEDVEIGFLKALKCTSVLDVPENYIPSLPLVRFLIHFVPLIRSSPVRHAVMDMVVPRFPFERANLIISVVESKLSKGVLSLDWKLNRIKKWASVQTIHCDKMPQGIESNRVLLSPTAPRFKLSRRYHEIDYSHSETSMSSRIVKRRRRCTVSVMTPA